jgi:hypothetical protein
VLTLDQPPGWIVSIAIHSSINDDRTNDVQGMVTIRSAFSQVIYVFQMTSRIGDADYDHSFWNEQLFAAGHKGGDSINPYIIDRLTQANNIELTAPDGLAVLKVFNGTNVPLRLGDCRSGCGLD